MPFDLTDVLVIGITSQALFDLRFENQIFEEKGLEEYSRYQIENEHALLPPGTGFPIVKAILHLNNLVPGTRKAEVILLSKSNSDSSLRLWNSIKHHELDITRGAFTGGQPLTPYLAPFKVDLFLSSNEADVSEALLSGCPSAVIYHPPTHFNPVTDQIRIAFDGDAVLFSSESEAIYQNQGLEAFQDHELLHAEKPMSEGPFAKLLRIISFLQKEQTGEPSPVRTALVTARNSPSHERVIRTLREWDIRIDEVFFLGGVSKHQILSAFGAHIFFDDQDTHCSPASLLVPTARVPGNHLAGHKKPDGPLGSVALEGVALDE